MSDTSNQNVLQPATDVEDYIKPDIHSSARDYQKRFSGAVGNWFLAKQNNLTKECLIECKPDTPVIDFGGGHGQNIEVCQSLGLAFDILSSDNICNQEIIAHRNIQNIHFHLGLLTASNLAPNSYEVALSYRMLPHLTAWREHIQELCIVSNRLVIVEFPNRRSINSLSEKLFSLKKRVEQSTRHFELFSLNEIESEFKKNGFKLISARGQYLLPMVFHRLIKNVRISNALEKTLAAIINCDKFGSPLICKFQRID